MDATRTAIRRMLLEAAYEPDFGEEFRPGDKGMYLDQASRWVTWPAKWPSGDPHHDWVLDEFFRYDDIVVRVSITPSFMMQRQMPGVQIETQDFAPFEADMEWIVSHVTRNVRSDSPLYLDAADDDTYQGTVASYLADYESRSE